jgi:hypothetical protein
MVERDFHLRKDAWGCMYHLRKRCVGLHVY